jgi:thiamine pyrophosphate-dependent acetolactate synthase large subunit-like protein
VWQ